MSESTHGSEDGRTPAPFEVDELLGAMYSELRNTARRRLARQPPGQTLTATALVHEIWLRMQGAGSTQWKSRAEFFAAAGTLMRNILVDRAREKATLKRGGDRQRESITPRSLTAPLPSDDLQAVHEALEKLEKEDPRSAQLVMLRSFSGMTIEEAAEALGIAPRTARSDWTFARVWLHDMLSRGDEESEKPKPSSGRDPE
jgi:RNA polymerase sigma factor (TIGR02999 family)